MTSTAATSNPDQVPRPVFAGETVLGTRSFPTTRTGYRAMLAWIGEFGDLARIGVEGTRSYGASLTRHLRKAGVVIP